jgi:flagellar hook-associated protein 3 FlgL
MSQAFLNRRHNASLRSQLNTLVSELSTGQVSDVSQRIGGDFTQLSRIERQLSSVESYQIAGSEMRIRLERAQLALGAIGESISGVETRALSVDITSQQADRDRIAADGREVLNTIVSQMNARSGGDALFAGDAVSGNALASADVMLADVEAAVLGLTDPDDIFTAIDDWFDAPAGFETVGYLGSDSFMSDRRLTDTDRASFETTANDGSVRDALNGALLLSLVDNGLLAGDATGQADIIRHAGEVMAGASAGIVQSRADIGTTEALVDQAGARLSAEASAIQILKTELISMDPYETATRLEEVQLQLETHYTLTARLSRLSLVEYLR